MFVPKERKRHALPLTTAPTRAEAETSQLFSPLRLPSGLTLSSRTWVPAMVPWRATEDGFVTDDNLTWYERFADGQPGAIVVEATGIRDVPSGPLLRIGHDRFIPGLAKLASRVREASGGRTRLFIQLIDFLRIRRRPSRAKYLERFLVLDPATRDRIAAQLPTLRDASDETLREALLGADDALLETVLDERQREALWRGARDRVTDTQIDAIAELPRVLPSLFADAALRAQQAGFDGVELHYAHAYTMASFLSRLNTRHDGYGASLEGRLRLPLEVLAAVRARVGKSFTVGARILCDEAIEGGTDAHESPLIGARLALAGLDFLSLSTGGKFEDAKQPKVGEAAYPYTGPSGYECMPTTLSDQRGPFLRNVAKQAAVRQAIRAEGSEVPTVAAGGISTFEHAEAILTRGDADLIGAARQSLADPDWFLKLRRGAGDAIRRCEYTNYCEGLDQKHKVVTCKLWDRVDLDGAEKLTSDGRRRLVAPPWRVAPPDEA